MHRNIEELDALLLDWESGSLDDKGIERLREILKSDASARSHFVDMQIISAALQQDADASLGLPFDGEQHLASGSTSKATLTTRRPRRPLLWVSIAASLFVCVFGSWLVYLHVADDSDRPPQVVETGDRKDSARYERWNAWSADLRRNPHLIVYYAFDEPGDWERRLACSSEPANPELDGAIVGAREVTGRWNGKRALEFKQPADRVRVQIPGEYGSLTLACWVKIDSLDRWYNSLFLTDGYDKGEPHWQILDDGRLYFSVRPVDRGESGPGDYKALSPPFWKPFMNGKWIHLAVTCDVETNTIIHYLNGKVLSRHAVPEVQMPKTTRIGTASIGNWALPTQPDARIAIRNLNGSIDELAIFAAALTAEEIKEIYEHGKP